MGSNVSSEPRESIDRLQTGLVHIYCGDGKGKTTCGMGLCLRAAGYGYKVLIYQFMKDNSTSERKILEQVPNVTLVPGLEKEKFSFRMSEQEKQERRDFYNGRLREVTEMAVRDGYQVLFLDEAVYCIAAGMLDESVLIDFLKNKPETLEVILTGQGPSQQLMELADYVSEIKKVRHPFDRKIPARPGIER